MYRYYAYADVIILSKPGGIVLITSAHQPAYLPWAGFFHKIILSDIFVILDEVQFEKGSFINRNKIKTATGAQWITVPIYKIGYTTKRISEIEINNDDDWERKHWMYLYTNYKKAPYFNRYSDFFQSVYEEKWVHLIDLIMHTLNFFLEEMNVHTKIIKQSELHTIEKKEKLVMEICSKLNQDKFIFGTLGKNYVSKEMFNEKGIKIYFQEYHYLEYEQQWGKFIPDLSIVDLFFNLGAENTAEIIMKDNMSRESLETFFAEY